MRNQFVLVPAFSLLPATLLGQPSTLGAQPPAVVDRCRDAIALPSPDLPKDGAALSGEIGSISSAVPIPNACHAPLQPVRAEEPAIRNMGEPLYVIDGAYSSATDFNRLAPTIIDSISILKGEQAAEQYGADANSGVVVVRTRAGGNSGSQPEAQSAPERDEPSP